MSGRIVIMGVSGAGKTVVGTRLAAKLGVPFVDADDHHSQRNIEKMAAGQPLNDEDRAEWLDGLAGVLSEHTGVVLACSALKALYRARLGKFCLPPPRFIYLSGSFDLIRERLQAREGHYFAGENMLASQFNDLEVPPVDSVPHVMVDAPLDEVVHSCIACLSSKA